MIEPSAVRPSDLADSSSDAHAVALASLRARTPARLLEGRAGPAYRTATALALRRDHAAARDAVRAEVELPRDLGPGLVSCLGIFEAATRATTKDEYLLRPDLGRELAPAARLAIQENCPRGPDLQVVVGDGLSAAAVAAQVPTVLPALLAGAARLGWAVGRPFFVRYCRVGVLNDVGDVLDPEVVVLLIGERPGLAAADSLSAYLAWRPRPGDTDAKRNLISNIHARGTLPAHAAPRILALAGCLRQAGRSGVGVKEVGLPGAGVLPPGPGAGGR